MIRPAFELAHFTVREGEEEALIAERAEMVRALRRAFPAARSAWLTRQEDGTWLDIVLWSCRARAWFRHIAESHGLRHVDVVHEEVFGSNTGTEPA